MIRPSFYIEKARFSPYLLDGIIYLAINDDDFLRKIYSVVKPKVFSNERELVLTLVYEYFEEYKAAPKNYFYDIVEDFLYKRPSQRNLLLKYCERLKNLTVNKSYIINKFSSFLRDVICKKAIEKAKNAIDKGEIKKAEEIILEDFRLANTLNSETVFNLLEDDLMKKTDFLVVNMFTYIDLYDTMVGGFYRKELVLIFGDTSVGKTWMTIYFGKMALVQGKNVLHITLETAKELIAYRYAMAFTSTNPKLGSQSNIVLPDGEKLKISGYSKSKVRKAINVLKARKGKLWLYEDTGLTFSKFKNIVNNIEVTEGVIPDIIILDSPDQMVSEKKYNELRLEEKFLYKQLLDFTKERNVTLIVTTQANRKAHKRRILTKEDVAEGFDKIRIVDTVWALSQDEEDLKNSVFKIIHIKSRLDKKCPIIKVTQCLDIGQMVLKSEMYVDDRNTKILQNILKKDRTKEI